jgi:nicotinamide riboside transporter PnuC
VRFQLVGVIALEIVCILVTGAFNGELLAVISGLVGSLVTAFVMGKKA